MNKSMIRIFSIFLLTLVIFTIGCYAKEYDSKNIFPFPGNTITEVLLQKDTFKIIYAHAKTLDKDCNDIKVTNTLLTLPPQNLEINNGRATSGYWKEKWTVNYCGKNKDYPIDFQIDPKTGGTNFVVNFKD